MIFYLTFNDLPSGIFSSQVIDVVKFCNHDLKANVKLVSFISSRSFFKNKHKIKQEYPSAIVLPMFPGVHNWKLNWIFLYALVMLKNPNAIIGRSVLATQLALSVKRKCKNILVAYDGRGAIAEEWKEYQVITNPVMLSQIDNLEKDAVINSDFRIAVSQKLVDYWKLHFQYQSHKHVVIPCTLNAVFENASIDDNKILLARNKLGFKDFDIVFVYSGSIAAWQSFSLLNDFLTDILIKSAHHKILFLSDVNSQIEALAKKFPLQVVNIKVAQAEVPNYLVACNYGILIREQSNTNKVASPVKFAEYLACGLPVIISDNLGDYSEFVIKHTCGSLYSNFKEQATDKQYLKKLAYTYFSKANHASHYQTVLNNL